MSIAIEVVDRTGRDRSPDPVAALVQAVLTAEDLGGAVTVAFVGEQEMTDLNGRFRGLPEPTDVLSFRYADGDEQWPDDADREPGSLRPDEEGPAVFDLGEVVVCPAVVERYAEEEGVDFNTRLAWTLVHGVLHLVGYDHEKDDGEMRRREQVLLADLDHVVQAFSAEDR